jgi:hypothetical protein
MPSQPMRLPATTGELCQGRFHLGPTLRRQVVQVFAYVMGSLGTVPKLAGLSAAMASTLPHIWFANP